MTDNRPAKHNPERPTRPRLTLRLAITLTILVLGSLPAYAQQSTPVATPMPVAAATTGEHPSLSTSTAPAASPTTVAVTGSVVVAVILIGTALNGLAILMLTTACRSLERTYRRQENLKLEVLQSQVVAQRRAEVARILADEPDGWQRVLAQLLADALPGAERHTHAIGTGGVLSLSASPAPCFTVAGAGGRTFVFTTLPDELRRVGLLKRREPVIPLDAGLHPAARIEMGLVWEHLARKRVHGRAPALARRAEWFLVGRGEGEGEGR